MEIACPGIILSRLPTILGYRIQNLPPSHLNHQIIFRDSRFPYRETNDIIPGMNNKRDMERGYPEIILSQLPTFTEHRIQNLPPSHLNYQIIFRDSRFPYRETNIVFLGMNKKTRYGNRLFRNKIITLANIYGTQNIETTTISFKPGIILSHKPTVVEHRTCHHLI